VTRTMLPFALAGGLVVASAGFALERSLALSASCDARTTATAELEGALALAAKHPGVFGRPAISTDGSLKSAVQDFAARRGLAIGFLSESERETDRGGRQRQVVVRLVQPTHGNLVRFLGDVEMQAGAIVKEIHVRPLNSQADVYEDAEVVVVRSGEAAP
jgi:hypothetical protein